MDRICHPSMSGARLVPPLIILAAPHHVRASGIIFVSCRFVEAGGTHVLFADPMSMRPTVIPAVRVLSAFTGRVCVWPPVQDELLLSMRFQSLVLTSMTSPPYPRPQ